MRFILKLLFPILFLLIFNSPILAITQPTISAPSTVDKGGAANIRINLGSEQSSYYNILFQRVGANGTNIPITDYIILCGPDSEPSPCEFQESPSNPEGITGTPTYNNDPDLGQTVTFSINTSNNNIPSGTYHIVLKPDSSNDFTTQTSTLVINDPSAPDLQLKIIKIGSQDIPPANPSNIDIKTTSNLAFSFQLQNKITGQYLLQPVGFNFNAGAVINCPGGSPDCGTTVRLPSNGLAPGTYNVNVNESTGAQRTLGHTTFTIVGDESDRPTGSIFLPTFCKNRNDPTFNQGVDVECSKSAGVTCNINGEPGILTAIGCIPTDPGAFMNRVMRFAAAAGGGIALLLMIFGAIQMVASAGNPQTLKAGTDTFTAAVIGLLFVIFATLLLQIIGVDILSIPGFSPS